MSFSDSTVIDKTSKELPDIRQLTTLKDFQPPKIAEPPVLRSPLLEKQPRHFFPGIIIVGVLLLAALGLAVFTNNRLHKSNKEYAQMNKDLYQISLSLKSQLNETEKKLQLATKIKNRLAYSRQQLMKSYRIRTNQYQNVIQIYTALLGKEGNYKQILAAKNSQISQNSGNLRIAETRIAAFKEQQEILLVQVKERAEQIKDLTNKFMASINQQKVLIHENLDLKKETERLSLKN